MDELLVAHDFDRADTLAEDHVLGVGAATRTLAALTPRRDVARALDVGTGNGAQALLAAAHADHVIATDINRRAVWLARLNAALNGRTNVEVRAGDAFEPVAQDRFHLIVANPPFVVSPDQTLTFRDSPLGGEALSQAIVESAAAHLEPAGTACILANWVVRPGHSEVDAPTAWVTGLDCDSLILHHDTLDPLAYAQRWMLAPAGGSAEAYEATLDRWLAYYAREGAAGIASGAIILRRIGQPTRRSRTRAFRMPRRPVDGGDHVERMLRALGRFDGPGDPHLADATFALVEPHDLEQRLTFEDGRYQAGEAMLRLARSAGVEARVPADLLEALFLVDGRRRLGDILDEVATTRDVSSPGLRIHGLPVFLSLFERGYLTIPESRAA